jgi:hypothetical protein
MRKMRYRALPAMGPGSIPVSGTLKSLLLEIPYLLLPYAPLNIIPPHNVLNELLSRGVEDAGMSGGCKWKPFQITAEEYSELIRPLEAIPIQQLEKRFPGESIVKYQFVEPPPQVQSFEDWQWWRLQLVQKGDSA